VGARNHGSPLRNARRSFDFGGRVAGDLVGVREEFRQGVALLGHAGQFEQVVVVGLCPVVGEAETGVTDLVCQLPGELVPDGVLVIEHVLDGVVLVGFVVLEPPECGERATGR